MAKTVFILGAGASKEAGAPLMDEFLDTARDLYASGQVSDANDRKSFETVFGAINQLRITHYKSYIDLDNIEAVFGAFEMARLLKGSAKYTEQEIDAIIFSIKKVISKTLELTMKFHKNQNTISAPKTYGDFARIIATLNDNRGNYLASVLTFNYDLGLDLALYNDGIRIDYALSNDEVKGNFKLLKLHGSLNWGRCEKCNVIIPRRAEIFRNDLIIKTLFHDTRTVALEISSDLSKYQHSKECDGHLELHPVIVPPTWNKTEHHSALREVWAQAGKELAEAENIIVVGYSHPISDLFFRYLFALGSVGEATIRRFWVFDPAPGDEIENRYRELIGTGIDKRFQMFKNPFSEAIGVIDKELRKVG